MKIYNQGVLLQERSEKGTFTFKSKVKRAWVYLVFMTKINVLALLTTAFLIAIGATFFAKTPVEAQMVIREGKTINVSQSKIDALKDQLAAIVHQGETKGLKVKQGEIFSSFDPNSKMRAACMQIGGRRQLDCESYGPYQIKIGTVQHYAVQVYGHEVTQLDAMTITTDPEKSKDFFVQCSLKVTGCAWNWTAANNNRVAVETLINVIRTLEQ